VGKTLGLNFDLDQVRARWEKGVIDKEALNARFWGFSRDSPERNLEVAKFSSCLDLNTFCFGEESQKGADLLERGKSQGGRV